MTIEADWHFRHSTLRERIVEHVFVGDVLLRCWQLGKTDVEVLRSEFDAGGYDIVIGLGSTIRHVQLKTKMARGRTNNVNINLRLAEKPSGCIVWIVVDENLRPLHYLWFGAEPGMPMPDIGNLPIARHKKATSEGIKNFREQLRILRSGLFKRLNTLDDVLIHLLGSQVVRFKQKAK